MTKQQAYVLLAGRDAGLRESVRIAANRCRDALADKAKRAAATKELRTVVDYFAAREIITPEEADGLYHAFYFGL